MRMTVAQALRQVSGNALPFVKLFEHGTLVVEMYQPIGVDRQQPHDRDELYVVAAGHGRFFDGTTTQPVAPGDVLFVPAGTEHRFVEFSDDFATWVFFYGPSGGEAQSAGGK